MGVRAGHGEPLHEECFMYVSEEHEFGFLFVCLFVFVFLKTGFLCVAPAVLEHRNPPASASQVLGLQACTTTPGFSSILTAKAHTRQCDRQGRLICVLQECLTIAFKRHCGY